MAFHVDTTQRREGYKDEVALHEIRRDYIERARGLGLMVIFNTTIHDDNFHELPAIVEFFVANAKDVGLVSFQLQAATGRGEWRERDDIISLMSVRNRIEQGAGKSMPWDAIRIGHSDCHSYLPTFVTNNRVFPIVNDANLFAKFIHDFSGATFDRNASLFQQVKQFGPLLAAKPQWIWQGFKFVTNHWKNTWKDVIAGRGRIHKLTFFVQNFMDENHLDEERVEACSFMVMTADGPVSMCKHNANRDDYILKPLQVANDQGEVEIYEPLTWVESKQL